MRFLAMWVALPLALGGICTLGMEQSALPAGASRAVRVLFIGDSLTYVNDLPGLHPTAAGAYLAGAVIYARHFERSPIGLPARLILRSRAAVEVSADDARFLYAPSPGRTYLGGSG